MTTRIRLATLCVVALCALGILAGIARASTTPTAVPQQTAVVAQIVSGPAPSTGISSQGNWISDRVQSREALATQADTHVAAQAIHVWQVLRWGMYGAGYKIIWN